MALYSQNQAPPPNDPAWPRGYPYECVAAWTNPSDSSGNVSVGTRGMVVSHPAAQGLVGITRPITNAAVCWIPMSYIQIGVTRKYGEVDFDIPTFYSEATSTDLLPAAASRLERATYEWAGSLRGNLGKMPWLPIWFMNRLRNDSSHREMINDILRGIPARARQVLDTANFTVQDLMRELPQVTKQSTGAGVYTRIYHSYANEPTRSPSQYVGKTINFTKRDFEHLAAAAKESSSNHYKRAKGAQAFMGILWQPVPPSKDKPFNKRYAAELTTIVEQLFVDLFECYCDEVVHYQPPAQPSPNPAQQVNIQEQNNKLAKYMQDKDAAIALTASANNSFSRSQWPGGRSRANYGTHDGCNWNSPLLEAYHADKTIWTKESFSSANLDVFHRTPIRVTGREDNSNYIGFHLVSSPNDGSPRHKFVPTIPLQTGLVTGGWVYPVIEMTQDGSPHHLNWSRLPTFGPWPDWERARSWALKIEFEDAKGQWKHVYIRSQKPLDIRKVKNVPDAPASHNGYAQGIAIYRMLRQIRFNPQGRPPWMVNYGVARVKEQFLDWLDQKIRVRDLKWNQVNQQLAPQREDYNTMALKYRGVGLNSNVAFGAYDGNTRGRTPRNSCDSCYLLNIAGRTLDNNTGVSFTTFLIIARLTVLWQVTESFNVDNDTYRCVRTQSDQNYGHDICVRCRNMGRACTWTVGIEVCPANDARFLALVPEWASRGTVRDIPDPDFVKDLDRFGT